MQLGNYDLSCDIVVHKLHIAYFHFIVNQREITEYACRQNHGMSMLPVADNTVLLIKVSMGLDRILFALLYYCNFIVYCLSFRIKKDEIGQILRGNRYFHY
jgi:hypothetical protein